MVVNLKKDIIDWLLHERYMGCIIFGEGNIGKTSYIRSFIKKNTDIASYYLDVQHIFLENNLSNFVFELNPKKFVDWCLKYVTENATNELQVVFIDNFDFLINLWDDSKQKELMTRICNLEKAVFPKPFIVVVQAYNVLLESVKKQDMATSRRIISFHDMEAI